MSTSGAENFRNEALFIARVLLALGLLVIGWQKMMHFPGTVNYMSQMGVPAPSLTSAVVVVAEFFFPLAIILGLLTRPLSLLLCLFMVVTACMGHHFWTLSGNAFLAERAVFFKNLALGGGFLVLYCTGAGRYAVDAMFSRSGSLSSGSALRD